jgi:hypothetical protein
MVGIKYDKGKPRIDLIPPNAIFEVAGVLTDGVEEYGEHNWRTGIAYSRLYAAIQRHLLAFWKGDDIDQSGHRALAHACTDIMMLMEMPKNWDDRYKPEAHINKNLQMDYRISNEHAIPIPVNRYRAGE